MSDKSSIEADSLPFRRFGRLAVLLLTGSVLACFLWYRNSGKVPEVSTHEASDREAANPVDLVPIPEPASSRFRNATTEVGYVGNQACVECHPFEHESYLHTNHSRSMSSVDIGQEPPDGEFFHELSGRHYRVYRKDEALRLQEFILDADENEVVLEDHAAAYSLGSGNYARMYLVEVGDYLIESPMTWYPRKQEWGMSAGYEKDAVHPGFTREVGWGCVYCHSGRVDRVGGSEQRLHVEESAISCERCHGPGELHVQEREAGRPIRDGIDDTIVNLKHLSRARKEDVCSQCHLSSAADVAVRTRDLADFRPGMRMSDFRVSYRIDRPESARTVSGQILQLRMSRCYIESETMTCVTCHDPHADAEESVKIEQYRLNCLTCHQTESCGAPPAERNATQPADNCIACHMPRGPSDIPHFSFTHHQIGIHESESKKTRINESDQLIPVGDVSHLPELEQLRMLGLANDQFAAKLAGGLDDDKRYDPYYRELSKVFAARSRRILNGVRMQGVRDAEMEAFFTRLFWKKKPDMCIEHAQAGLKHKQIAPEIRADLLFKQASTYFDLGQFDRAEPYLEQLVQLERDETSLMLLGICHQQQGDLAETVRCVKDAIRANPARADLHVFLASLYRQIGEIDKSRQHLKHAELLSRTIPQPR